MDLSPEGLAAQARELLFKRIYEHSIENAVDAITAALVAIRDAATAAERERAIAIVERQPYYPDTHTGLRQQWVKDQILTALRGGDHE